MGMRSSRCGCPPPCASHENFIKKFKKNQGMRNANMRSMSRVYEDIGNISQSTIRGNKKDTTTDIGEPSYPQLMT
jgi:hypothetical protein